MISLVPSWAQHLEEFWITIKNRNFWFIKLRYFAVFMLIGFIVLSTIILDFSYSSVQLKVISLITLIILLYNVALHYLKDKVKPQIDGFNFVHLSLVQMFMDLITLSLLIYYTGGIESPLLMLYIFHMIIGSLILPGKVIYPIAFVIVAGTYLLATFEYLGYLTHHPLSGFLDSPLKSNYKFVVIQSLVFGFVIFASVLIANRIARQLYKLEQNLVESFSKLENAEQDKQRYIMAVVHEIKAPLTAVKSFLEIILNKLLGEINPKVEEKLERAHIRCNESIELINDVLKISKIRLLDELKKTEVRMEDVLLKIISNYKDTSDQKSITVIFENKVSKSTMVLGDIGYLEIIFSNLINNAIKYTPENGKVKIVVQKFKELVQVSISDSGVGIPAKDLPNIFKDFFRASNIKGKGFEGAGLGLSAVKKLIEKHHGTIDIESPSDIGIEGCPGTKVTVSLPQTY